MDKLLLDRLDKSADFARRGEVEMSRSGTFSVSEEGQETEDILARLVAEIEGKYGA